MQQFADLTTETRDNILFALRNLNRATSGEITKFMEDKTIIEIEEKFQNTSGYGMVRNQEETNKLKQEEISDKRVSKRTVQNYLSTLETSGWVKKDKHNIYSLSRDGRYLNIFGELYGQFLLDGLKQIPMGETQKEKLENFILLVGIYITFIFLDSKFARVSLGDSPNRRRIFHKEVLKINDPDWIEHSVPPKLLYQWFNDLFYPAEKKQKPYTKRDPDLDGHNMELEGVIEMTYHSIFNNLQSSQIKYYREAFPNLVRSETKKVNVELEVLKRQMREEKKQQKSG